MINTPCKNCKFSSIGLCTAIPPPAKWSHFSGTMRTGSKYTLPYVVRKGEKKECDYFFEGSWWDKFWAKLDDNISGGTA